MTIAPEIGLIPSHQMLPTAALVAYANLLALPGIEIERAVSREVMDNPALVFDGIEAPSPGYSPIRTSAAGEGTAEHDRPARESWPDTLLRDLRIELPAEDAGLAAAVVGSLDDHGYLREDLSELARICGVDRGRVETVVRVLHGVGPPGIGARDARHCLLLQLDRLEAMGAKQPIAREMVVDHLEALGRGGMSEIAQKLGADVASVVEARAFIRRELRPYPCVDGTGSRDAGLGDSNLVRPDVAVSERTDAPGTYVVEVLEATRFKLHVDPLYRSTAREEGGQIVAELVRRADFFLARLRERWTTLGRITGLVAERERDFLRGGPDRYVPLTRSSVAAALGIHESTVSRATAGKYVQLPSLQVVAFAELFDGSLGIRTVLRSIVETEARPLSDAELCRLMNRAGHPIARRTVAKYRDRMGILPSRLR